MSKTSLSHSSAMVMGAFILVFILLGVLFKNIRELQAAKEDFGGLTGSASASEVKIGSYFSERNIHSDKGILCAGGTFLVGISPEGQALCKSANQDTRTLSFVGGFIDNEVCVYQNQSLADGCRQAKLKIPPCVDDVRPFVIRSGKLDYLFPSLCFEQGLRCYNESGEGTRKKRIYFRCENYEIRGRGYVTKSKGL